MSYDPEVVAYFENFFTNNRCAFAALTLLAYEYVSNFHREANLFWKRKLSGASVLFFFARYTPLLSYLIADVQFARMPDTSCSAVVYATLVLSGFQYVPWAAFSALRALALSGRNWPLSILIFLLSSVPVGVNYSKFRGLQPFNDDIIGCGSLLYGFSPDVVHKQKAELTVPSVTAVSRSCLILADLLVAIVTWWSTYKTSKLTRGLKGFEQNALSRVMLRDGSIYFVVLVILNFLHLVFTSTNVAATRSFGSFLPLFTEPLTGVLVVRFLLNLQAANRRTAYSQSSPSQIMGNQTLQFAGVLDSLSGSLDIGEDHLEHQDEPMPLEQGTQTTISDVRLDLERGGRKSELSDVSV